MTAGPPTASSKVDQVPSTPSHFEEGCNQRPSVTVAAVAEARSGRSRTRASPRLADDPGDRRILKPEALVLRKRDCAVVRGHKDTAPGAVTA